MDDNLIEEVTQEVAIVQPVKRNEPEPGPAVPSGTSGKPDSTPNGETNITGETTNVTVVRRAVIDTRVSEAEANAFDATTRALELYLELKEDCKSLQPNCGFTKECPDSKAVCERIEKLCKGVKPLEVKYHYGGKVTEQCTLVRTTDTWVTSTSLHTTTMTTTPTITSTVTFTSTRKCKPTKCTTDSSKETQEEDVKPDEGVNIRASAMLKMMLLGAIIIGIL
ncbi:hypothetical protein MERGE_002351 [Pneumocystis wakefieldiae]|uniref:Major surface glycoprotein 2 C-terminal domain-containing protein n=1 Tax=Pneumocystis wakefieldiae TaxID=38082 RepID=A0A899FX77_9ASCO|nr:hypothetical protein MERGE_002351 [Pneumocystis wakefieldiae]